MRKLKSVPLLSVLTISLIVSLSLVQSVSARPKSMSGCRVRRFTYDVYIFGGVATSSLDWLEGTAPEGCYPIKSWGDEEPWYDPPWAGPPISEYYEVDGIYVCYGDWCMECATYEGNFRYQWLIYWGGDVISDPEIPCLGGFFIFSQGTEDFKGMLAFGKAWVELEPQGYPFGYQYHVGLMLRGPDL